MTVLAIDPGINGAGVAWFSPVGGGTLEWARYYPNALGTKNTLAERVAALATAYDGPVAVKSFDPHLVTALRDLAPTIPRGIVGETRQDDPAYAALSPSLRRSLPDLLHFDETRPDFLSWRVDDLPCAPTVLCRLLGQRPVMTWTVRNPDQRRHAEAHADQMVFEGFRP